MKKFVYAVILLCITSGHAAPATTATAEQVPVAAAPSPPTAPCLVSGQEAYAYIMPEGYAVKKCSAPSTVDRAALLRATYPEMWCTVTNISDPRCRAENDRRNTKHDPPSPASAPAH